jgi:hypothetical protein
MSVHSKDHSCICMGPKKEQLAGWDSHLYAVDFQENDSHVTCGECIHSHRDSLAISWSVAITSAQCDRAIVSASRGNLGFNWLTKNVLQGTLISELWRWRLPAKLSDTFLYFFAVFIFFISIFFCVCKSFIIICFLYLTSISLLCFFFFSCCTHERIWTCNFKFLYTRAWMNSLTIILIMPRFS